MNIKNAVAIVTGGTGGLGQCIVRALDEAGAHVVIAYRDSEETAQAMAEEVRSKGGRVLPVRVDLANPADIRNLMDITLSTFGRIDILINDAACNQSVSFQDLDGLTPELWETILGINLTAPYLCIRAVAPCMKKQGGGRIVNVTSISGLEPGGSSIAYAVSKAGLIHLTRCMAVALAPEVLVNSVAPGFMEGTRTSERLTPERIASVTEKALIRRAVSKEDVARQILDFIVTDSVTGQTLCMCGGRFFH